ncbi:hypothetical protein FA95DRAFT_292965 [Auriscalpium vulgare]|uniref:Uncharacterized protein n=1 Tax=Auriscalpium vulgare TaxID=40419 RepID=A0ACB8RKT3_9AGAM|nr:hypothetical protein FA95DRAFT_292965 [Auriscalpium vulgare]
MSAEQLSPRSAEFFRRTRELDIGVAFEEIERRKDERQALLGKVVEAFEEVGKWKGDELFVIGEQVSSVDVTIAAHLRRLHLQKSIQQGRVGNGVESNSTKVGWVHGVICEVGGHPVGTSPSDLFIAGGRYGSNTLRPAAQRPGGTTVKFDFDLHAAAC